MPDQSQVIQQQLQQALQQQQSVHILAGNSLQAFCPPIKADRMLDVSTHSGIIHYAPEELVIQVRAATSLQEVINTLAQKNQQLPFEPPQISERTTIGGIVSSGLCGHSRPFYGDIKDALLGVRMLNGLGENLVFGGTVIKNVAGFDLARLQAGSFGRYGVLLDLAIKVIPKSKQISYQMDCDEQQALRTMSQLRQRPLPFSAMSYYQGQLYLRIAHGHDPIPGIGKSLRPCDTGFWQDSNHFKNKFFQQTEKLWRISLPADSPPLSLSHHEQQIIHWAGTRRWLKTTASIEPLRQQIQHLGGQIHKGFAPFNSQDLAEPLKSYYQQLKLAFDPHQRINPL